MSLRHILFTLTTPAYTCFENINDGMGNNFNQMCYFQFPALGCFLFDTKVPVHVYSVGRAYK